MRRLTLTLILVAAFALTGRPAAAQSDSWVDRLVADLQALRTTPSCFGGRTPSRVHVLGLLSEGVEMDRATQIETLGRIGEALSRRRINMDVTQADTFQFIATRSADMSPARVAEIDATRRAADNADITVLVQAYSVRPDMVSARVIFWSGATAETANQRCTPTLLLDIPRRARVDPTCAQLFEAAKASGDRTLFAFFKANMAHCPQAAEIDGLLAGACRDALARADRARTADAYAAFIRDNADCPEVTLARQMQQTLAAEAETLRAASACRQRFAAVPAGSAAAFDAFAAQNPTCAEAAIARTLAVQLRANAAAAPRAPAVTQAPAFTPQPSQAWCFVDDVRPPDAWLALRTEPTTRRGRRLARLPSGTAIAMLGEQSGHWHRVETENGMIGWVSWQRARWIAC